MSFLRVIILCISFCSFLEGREMRMDYGRMSGQAQSEAIDEICERFGLQCSRSGGGAMDVVRTLHFGTHSDQEVSIEEARRITVEAMEMFAYRVNVYRELRPFLVEYPFPSEDLGFSVRFNNDPDKILSDNKIDYVTCVADKVIYFKHYEGDVFEKEIYRETLHEARKIVYKERGNAPFQSITVMNAKSANKSPTLWGKIKGSLSGWWNKVNSNEQLLPKYIGPTYERNMLWELDKYSEQVAKKYGMTFHRAGNPTYVSCDKVTYGLDFFDDHMKSLDAGRVFAATLVGNFLSELRSNLEITQYHKHNNECHKNWKGRPPLTPEPVPEQMCLKIGYWDEKFDRPQRPLLAQILFVEGFFHYYEADPETQRLKLVLKESYEEAMAFKNGKTNE